MSVVGDMFEHVEQSRSGDAVGTKIRIFERRANDVREPSFTRVDGACVPRFNDNALPPRVLKPQRNEPVSATQIEQRAGRRKAADNRRDAAVAMLEPEGMVLDLEAGLVPLRRIGNARIPFRNPDSVVAEFQIPGDFLNVHAVRSASITSMLPKSGESGQGISRRRLKSTPSLDDLTRQVQIPFNKPAIAGNEYAYIADAIRRGHISGDGYYTKQCQRVLEETVGVPRALLTTSCTHALEMSALLLDIREGDEVIVPSFTFVSTVNAFALRGARPVFIDIRPDTLNMDERRLEALITPRTRAIVVVHYAGVACEMDAILAIARRHGIAVIEDNAHGLFGRYKGRTLGTLGSMATQSFHETKNIQCGEGGALLINDTELIDRAEILREKGTNRAAFYRGQVDKYTWVDLGSSYVISDCLAAFLYAQLEQREQITASRSRIWSYYASKLGGWAQSNGVGLPSVPSYCEQAFHMFYMVMPSLESRQNLIEHLKAQGIFSVFHYVPLDRSPMGEKYGTFDCPETQRVADRLLRLPFYNTLTENEQARVVQAVEEFSVGASEDLSRLALAVAEPAAELALADKDQEAIIVS
jgi:dTDP-4-amino-4,6-dideoxygalactose transaminase